MRSCAIAVSLCLVPASGAWVTVPAGELHALYDVLWAVSDVHGQKAALERMLVAAGLAVPTDRGERIRWNPSARRQLLVVAGDSIDGGDDSVGTVLLLRSLQREAEAAGSRVIVLLGNHEVAFLAGGGTSELLWSASRWAEILDLPARPTAKELRQSAFGEYLRALPIAAFVGTWLFAHGGYLGGGSDCAALQASLGRLAARVEPRDRAAFRALLDEGAIAGHRRWWAERDVLSSVKRRLDLLGLDGLVIGHDPDALGAAGTIAMSRSGWLMKLDTGLKRGSRGMLLRCEVAQSAMSRCGISGEDGAQRPIPVR